MDQDWGVEDAGQAIESTAEETRENAAAPEPVVPPAVIEEAFRESLGRWNRLVSTTNWEKGRIIYEWRRRLIDAGAPQQAWSDEAWARRVGNLTGQHAGRLRRAWEQFGAVYEQYSGLFWSHFQAALDWSDAEMWLEGAVQNGWSVNQMRQKRGETLGVAIEDDADAAAAEPVDEDAEPDESHERENRISDTIRESTQEVFDPDFGDESSDDGDAAEAQDSVPFDAEPTSSGPATEPVRPFENLPELPSDLMEAFEAFKLAIIHHRLQAWQQVTCDDVVAALEALKHLARAPLSEA